MGGPLSRPYFAYCSNSASQCTEPISTVECPLLSVVALTYRATVDVPARFRNSKAVGAVLGLTPCKDQSGERDHTGAISKCGDEMMRVMLYEAAQILLTRTVKWSWLNAAAKKAIVALARRLAVILHRIWVDGTEFRWSRQEAAAA
jgi:hypothetical protein